MHRIVYLDVKRVILWSIYPFSTARYTIEACIWVLGIQDICHFSSRDIG